MLVLSALHLDVCGENTSAIELCLRLCNIRSRRGSALKSILCQLQRFAISIDGVVEEFLLCIGTAHFEVVDRKLGVQAQSRGEGAFSDAKCLDIAFQTHREAGSGCSLRTRCGRATTADTWINTFLRCPPGRSLTRGTYATVRLAPQTFLE